MNLENPMDRSILFYTDVAQETVGEVTAMILSIAEHDQRLGRTAEAYGLKYTPEPIKLYLNSYGGDAYACLGLVSIMQNCTTPIYTYVTGCAMSAGFIIAIAGHKRFCYGHSSYMWHQLSYGDQGKLQEKEEGMVESYRIQKIADQFILNNTEITKKYLSKMYLSKKDKYISPSEALELGIVDEIL